MPSLVKLWAVTVTVALIGVSAGGGYLLWNHREQMAVQLEALNEAEAELDRLREEVGEIAESGQEEDLIARVQALEDDVGEPGLFTFGSMGQPSSLWNAVSRLDENVEQANVGVNNLDTRIGDVEFTLYQQTSGLPSLQQRVGNLEDCVGWIVDGVSSFVPTSCP